MAWKLSIMRDAFSFYTAPAWMIHNYGHQWSLQDVWSYSIILVLMNLAWGHFRQPLTELANTVSHTIWKPCESQMLQDPFRYESPWIKWAIWIPFHSRNTKSQFDLIITAWIPSDSTAILNSTLILTKHNFPTLSVPHVLSR